VYKHMLLCECWIRVDQMRVCEPAYVRVPVVTLDTVIRGVDTTEILLDVLTGLDLGMPLGHCVV
jgi:hypothetical protein